MRWPREQFVRWVREAIEQLPDEFKRPLDNVSVFVKDRLSPQETEELGLNQQVLAFYRGQPLSLRGLGHALPAYHGALPDQIIIVQANIESICQSEAELKREIRHTVAHELAHYFGISDDRLKELGLY